MVFVLKCGSNSLVKRNWLGRPKGYDDKRIDEIAADTLRIRRETGRLCLLVSSGAMISGKDWMKKRNPEEIVNVMVEFKEWGSYAIPPPDEEGLRRFAEIFMGNRMLFREWLEAYYKIGEKCVLMLDSGNQTIRRTYTMEEIQTGNVSLESWNPEKCFDLGIVPVVNGNDFDTKGLNNDLIALSYVQSLGADQLILLTDIDGVHDRDPKEKGAKLIQQMTRAELMHLISGWEEKQKSRIGTGGMISKLMAAAQCPPFTTITIANASVPHVTSEIILEDNHNIGTRILPD